MSTSASVVSTPVTRRGLVAGAAATAALASVAAPLAAQAETAEASDSEDADAAEDEVCADGTPASVWGEAPKSVDEFEFAETLDCDLAVVGAGTSGMPCAVSAAQAGLNIVVLEKQSVGFGMRDYIGGIGTTTQKDAGVEVDVKEITRDLLRYSSYRANPALIRQWAENSGEAVDWYTGLMADGGLSVWLETDINSDPDEQFKEYPVCHLYYNLEDDSITETKIMSNRMEAEGCDVRYATPMVQLIQEDGKVTGVIGQDEDGNYIRVNASKGVVLATGGYAANSEMMHTLNEKDCLSNVMVYCDPGATGDGLRAAHFAGGQMDVAHTAMYFQRGSTMPGSKGGDWTTPCVWWMGSQPFLKVNTKGERFGNESLPYDYDLHQCAGQPGHVGIQIFDSNWRDDVAAFHTIGCSRIVPAEQISQGYEGVTWTVEKVEAACFEPALEGGQLVQADTIEELAEKMGLPADTLVATVEHYNELCEAGEDTDFYKDAYRLRPVQEPPFYAVTVGGQLLCTMDGMQIDTEFHVLDEAGQPIEGLYAIGNDSGCYFADCYPEYIVGAAAGRSVTWGYLLGQRLGNNK